jgi:TolB-like protein/Tfp pilus assembly protein PilF
MSNSGIRFGSFLLDTEMGTLFRDGSPVPVSYRGLMLLAALVRKAGSVVSKDELLDAVWPNMVVEEGNLSTQVAVLRKALGVAPDGSDYIVNVPRIGYRFAGPVEANAIAMTQPDNGSSGLEPGPSIAVLPFANLALDPEQQYFAEGLAEDIITRLSRLSWLFVSARNSSFTYQANGVDIKRVGQELGVRYVLSGSVRRSGDRLRVTAQLNVADTGAQAWADRYELVLSDFFTLQDSIAESVLAAIEPELYRAENERFQSRAPQSLDAWGYVMRAMPSIWTWGSAEEIDQAQKLLQSAIAIDPAYARANSLLAWTHAAQAHSGHPLAVERLEFARTAAMLAMQTDPLDAWTHFALGYVQMVSRKFDLAIESLLESLTLNPSLSLAHVIAGSTYAYNGMSKDASHHLAIASRLSPRDFTQAANYSVNGLCRLIDGDYTSAMGFERRAVQLRPRFSTAWRTYAAAAGLAGDFAVAHAALAEAKRLQPTLSLDWIERYHPIVQQMHRQLYGEGLQAAGLD